jgi:diguanylate cyclase (GGDEF)-like protein
VQTLNHSSKLVAPIVSSSVALIAVTNFCIFRLLATSGLTGAKLLSVIWPMAVPASVAVILVMSVLYHLLQEVLTELEIRRTELLAKAQRDPLTSVGTREYFTDRLEAALVRFQRTGEKFAVVMLDLDHFKRVNDLHGHQTGDEVLKKAAEKLQSQLRACDTVARFGGDEFLILQTGVSRPSEVRQFCDRIVRELQQQFEIGPLQLRLPTSLGAVIANKRLQDAQDYIRAADLALYEAKRSGRNCVRFFSEELDEQLRRRDLLETELRQALRTRTGLTVHYQPQINATGEITGVEALFRWIHPELGEIAASEAIEIAEESELIDLIGEFVFRHAASFARQHPRLSVAVNLSPAQFSRADNLPRKMHELARKECIHPSQIEFEITEKLFMEIGGGTESQVADLREFGFRVALDDFGTGYSSLSYLRRFKVDRLKLDRSFIAEMNLQENLAVIRAVVSMAHLLGLEVIAEGIETPAQEAVALESGCDLLQGHLYGAAVAAGELRNVENVASKAA